MIERDDAAIYYLQQQQRKYYTNGNSYIMTQKRVPVPYICVCIGLMINGKAFVLTGFPDPMKWKKFNIKLCDYR